MKTAIYVRVSTKDQTYDQQLEPCKQFCKYKGFENIEIFKEVESTRKIRPIFQEMLKRAKNGEFQNIIVWKLDRAWRSSRAFIMDFDMLQSRGIMVISVMEGLDPTTPIGKAMMTILVALGELERENISMATKERLQALKNMKKKLGRPVGSKDKKKRKTDGYVRRYANKGGYENSYYFKG